jgi:hypothetical protein
VHQVGIGAEEVVVVVAAHSVEAYQAAAVAVVAAWAAVAAAMQSAGAKEGLKERVSTAVGEAAQRAVAEEEVLLAG